MEHLQYNFEATFDERIDHLADYEVEELRVMFTYFDSDRDGAITADQATRLFKMLGLEVNGAQVQELGYVFFPEFLKIVDTNVGAQKSSKKCSDDYNSITIRSNSITTILPNGKVNIIAQEREAKLSALTTAQRHAEQKIQDEWKLIDSFHRGSITLQELKDFVKICDLQISHRDLVRFMEIYGESTDIEEYTMILTKTGFEKFRREYDARSFDHHINGFPSDEDQENPSEEDDVDYIQTAGGAAAAKALSNLPSQLLNIQEAITAFQEGEEDNTAANE